MGAKASALRPHILTVGSRRSQTVNGYQTPWVCGYGTLDPVDYRGGGSCQDHRTARNRRIREVHHAVTSPILLRSNDKRNIYIQRWAEILTRACLSSLWIHGSVESVQSIQVAQRISSFRKHISTYEDHKE